MLGLLTAGAAGAALVYFFDPENGRRRRSMARDRAAAAVRRGSENLERYGRFAAGRARGAVQELAGSGAESAAPLDDAALARKVETEVFRDSDVPKGKININVEHGKVVLRGEVERPEQRTDLEAAARRVAGVRDVENLLHLPGAPAPMS